MKKSFWRRFFKNASLLACLLMVHSCAGARYQTYDVEGMCGSGSLNISLQGSGDPSAGILKATTKISYSKQMDCRIRLDAPLGYFIMVSIREIGFRARYFGACKDYIMINGIAVCTAVYREDENLHYQSSSNRMELKYHTSRDGLDNRTLSGYPGFTLTFTAFRKADHEHCSKNSTETFLCENEYCIWSGLTCDGHNNCGDLSDEDAFGNSNCGRTGQGSSVLIVLGLVIVFLLIIMCVATLLCTKNETVRRFSTRMRSRTRSIIPGRR